MIRRNFTDIENDPARDESRPGLQLNRCKYFAFLCGPAGAANTGRTNPPPAVIRRMVKPLVCALHLTKGRCLLALEGGDQLAQGRVIVVCENCSQLVVAEPAGDASA